MSVSLPHKNPEFYKKIINLFSYPVNDMNTLNLIFFANKCPFFPLIQTYYPLEAFEFLRYYKYLQYLVFNINNILPDSIKLLSKTTLFDKIQLTRKQTALLFLLSFFGLMPNNFSRTYNNFNVSQVLFAKFGPQFEFGRCFLNYLTVIGKWISDNNPILEQKIIYIRQKINRNFHNLEKRNFINLCEVNFIKEGSLLEGDASYCLDFANKLIGGSTLNGGCVQEEILFAIEPEAIISMLFMEEMDENDAIGIFNTIQYSKYKGYRQTFSFDGNMVSYSGSIKKHRIIAIDAGQNDKQLLNINKDFNKYKEIILRDLYKAYAGFNLINSENNYQKSIATGNWGCGVYQGIHQLKFLEQWIAASFAGVQRLDYYTFNEKKMEDAIQYYQNIKNNNDAGSLLKYLIGYILDMNNLIQVFNNLASVPYS